MISPTHDKKKNQSIQFEEIFLHCIAPNTKAKRQLKVSKLIENTQNHSLLSISSKELIESTTVQIKKVKGCGIIFFSKTQRQKKKRSMMDMPKARMENISSRSMFLCIVYREISSLRMTKRGRLLHFLLVHIPLLGDHEERTDEPIEPDTERKEECRYTDHKRQDIEHGVLHHLRIEGKLWDLSLFFLDFLFFFFCWRIV
jgi:hypothetical protein